MSRNEYNLENKIILLSFEFLDLFIIFEVISDCRHFKNLIIGALKIQLVYQDTQLLVQPLKS